MTLTWENVAAFMTVLFALAGLWWRVEAMCRKNTDDLAAFKTQVATEYMTKSGLDRAVEQIMAAVLDFKSDLNNGLARVSDRIDRLTEERIAHR